MNEKQKLLGAPDDQLAQPPPFPRTNLQFGPIGTGFAVQIQLADDIVIVKAFSAEAEEQICNILIQRRKELKQRQLEQLAVMKQPMRND